MQITLVLTLTLHLLSGVFWAGSTFALARTAAASADQLFWPQMGAAVIAVGTGGYLWHLLHPSNFGIQEQVLALGALCAILAAGAQSAFCGPALRQFKKAGDKDAQKQARVVLGQRAAAALLALTVICMAAARYI
jgi:hypothetical protein